MERYEEYRNLDRVCQFNKKKKTLWAFIRYISVILLNPFIVCNPILIALCFLLDMTVFVFISSIYVMLAYKSFDISQIFLISFAIYYIAFLVLWLIARKKDDHYEDVLDRLEAEVNEKLTNYYETKKREANIEDGCFRFENGIIVSAFDDFVGFGLNDNYGSIKLYTQSFSSEPYDKVENENYTFINKKISSVEFNRKFTVITPKGNEINAIKFLSPSIQVALINLYNDSHLPENPLLLDVSDNVLLMSIERKNVRGKFELVSLSDISKPKIEEKFRNIDLLFDTTTAHAYQVSRKFDYELRALRA